jgi:hypothetical protein
MILQKQIRLLISSSANFKRQVSKARHHAGSEALAAEVGSIHYIIAHFSVERSGSRAETGGAVVLYQGEGLPGFFAVYDFRDGDKFIRDGARTVVLRGERQVQPALFAVKEFHCAGTFEFAVSDDGCGDKHLDKTPAQFFRPEPPASAVFARLDKTGNEVGEKERRHQLEQEAQRFEVSCRAAGHEQDVFPDHIHSFLITCVLDKKKSQH